ncbi:XdhC/CoxI family protein [Flaviaesturariibacter flavus]|uniref:XdhC/CoxI family protein n=1 Tax=Flaviaesturariibacter flavus TaxID=2502780 RepID=A0A4R1BQP8_9BACT|nr:XdhC/CoxI family protein [Flaviaesturariibacter flavus]TCJ19617.1 XdhC/CoxI family protein [Flaviaesturariibacter flavus]
MNTWLFIRDKLNESVPVLLLWVLQSEGSSPGRRGFKMAVAADGNTSGTIGGGIMEHKLVEKARSLIRAGQSSVFLQEQYHDKQHSRDQSGMICSGSQVVAFLPLQPADVPLVDKLLHAFSESRRARVHLTPQGLALKDTDREATEGLLLRSEEDWDYTETIDQRPVVHIIGSGHVGLALSQQMAMLGFYVKLYENRPDLNTFVDNAFAHEKIVVDYERIDESIGDAPADYVVIMTFGYRDDKIVFRRLLHRKFFYLGMMGSESKIVTLMRELEQEGIPPEAWQHCHVPIGLPIYSKTAPEIAVSIAAEIIREKNRDLPTGRSGVTLEL